MAQRAPPPPPPPYPPPGAGTFSPTLPFPVAPQAPQAPGAPAPAAPRGRPVRAGDVWMATGVGVGAVFEFFTFLTAFGSLNSSSPDTGEASNFAGLTVAIGVAVTAFAVAWIRRRGAHPGVPALFAGAGVLGGLLLCAALPESFGILAELGWMILEGIVLVALLVLFLIALLVLHVSKQSRQAGGLGLGVALCHAVAYLVVSLYMLANLQPLAAEASAANSPSAGLVGAAGALMAVAWAMRRRR